MKLFKRKKNRSPLPQVSHTKGYYRFSREFPSVTDNEGFRNNELVINSPAQKTATRRKIAVVSLCTFIIAFICTALCLSISNLPVKESAEQTTNDNSSAVTLSGINGTRLTGEVLSYSSIESLLNGFSTDGTNAVIIEFKDAQGYYFFKPSMHMSAESISKASDNAKKIITDFRNAGIKVYAAVSCFADDIYARNHQDHTAYTLTAPESGSYDEVRSIWYAGETVKNAWLSPYSNEVLYCLNTIMSDIDTLGVDGIILENVILPISAEDENVRFEFSDQYESSAGEKIAQWLNYTANVTNTPVGIRISQTQMLHFAEKSTADASLSAGCDFIILDSRISLAKEGAVIGTKQYLAPDKTPAEYTSALLTFISDFLADNEINSTLIPIIDDESFISVIASLDSEKIQSCIIE